MNRHGSTRNDTEIYDASRLAAAGIAKGVRMIVECAVRTVIGA